MHGDLRDPAVVDRLLEGVDVLIHMAGTSVERPLPEIIENNLWACTSVYEGARRHGVKRVVFASSNHTIGMYPVDEKLTLDCAFRPDGFYGLSKVWGEAMSRMYWDKHGIEGINLRIGSTLPRPTEFRHLSTWLGHDDLLQLIDALHRGAGHRLPGRRGACRTTPAATGTIAVPSASATGRCRIPRTMPRRS